MGQGCLSARGLREKRGKVVTRKVISKVIQPCVQLHGVDRKAEVLNTRHRSMCIRVLSLLVLEQRQATTAWLLQWQQTRKPCQCPPHTAHASMIGSNSFAAIERSSERPSHCTWNQECRCHARQPQEPTHPTPSQRPEVGWSGEKGDAVPLTDEHRPSC